MGPESDGKLFLKQTVRRKEVLQEIQKGPLFENLRSVINVVSQLKPHSLASTCRVVKAVHISYTLNRIHRKPTIIAIDKKAPPLNELTEGMTPEALFHMVINNAALPLLEKRAPMYKPFWNDKCKEMSDGMWLPGADQPERVEKLNGLFDTVEVVNEGVDRHPEPPLVPIQPPADDSAPEKIYRSRKVRIYPDASQRQTLRKWLGTNRAVYNNALAGLKSGDDRLKKFDLRDKYTVAKGDNPNVTEWMKETPLQIRAQTVFDLVTNYKSALSNLKNRNISKFNLRFKAKKKYRNNDCLAVEKRSVQLNDPATRPDDCKDRKQSDTRGFYLFKTYMPEPIRVSKDRCLKHLQHGFVPHADVKILYHNDRWFMVLPFLVETDNEPATIAKPSVALDPGARKFHTLYSQESAKKVQFNRALMDRLHERLKKMSQLRSATPKPNHQRRKHLNRRTRALNNKMTSLREDMHKKLVKELTDRYATIYLPKFESQELIRKNHSDKFRLEVNLLAHYKFKMRLQEKAAQAPNKCRVVICHEDYTSKTCTCCGVLNDVGASEWYTCKSCKCEIDRDINGARNILIKNSV